MYFGYCAYWSTEATFWQMPHLYGTIRLSIWGYWDMEARIINSLYANGCTVLLHPTQYEAQRNADGSPRVRTEEQFRVLVAQAAARWKDHAAVIGMELLNEPNVRSMGGMAPTTAAGYAVGGFQSARGWGFNKPIVVNGPARVGEWQTYLRDMKAIPTEAEWSAHPYPQPLDVADYKASIRKQIKTWREITGRRPLWITETGIAVGDPQGFGEDEQRDRLEGIYRLCEDKGIRGLIVFRFQDGTTGGAAGGSASAFDHMGVVRQDKTFRPAYHRLKVISGNG